MAAHPETDYAGAGTVFLERTFFPEPKTLKTQEALPAEPGHL